MIFKDVLCPDIPRQAPKDCVASREDRIKLLESFNYNWKDWSFRDIIPAADKYSLEQRTYFETKPIDRQKLVEEMKSENERKVL